MPLHNLSVSKKPVYWALVIDGKQARIFACRQATHEIPANGSKLHPSYIEKSVYELEPVLNGILHTGSANDHPLGYEGNVTGANGNGHVHNSSELHDDVKVDLKHHFTKAIAIKLQHAHRGELFDHLILVASAKMIGELREQLTGEVQHCIVAVLSKDLAHFHGEELLHHLHDTLVEAHVA